MSSIKNFLLSVFTVKFFQKLLAYWLLIAFIYLFSDFAFLFFITFIFAYLFYSLAKNIRTNILNFIKNKNKEKFKIYEKILKVNTIIIFEYILFILLIILLLVSILPQISREVTELAIKTTDLSSWLTKYFAQSNYDVWFAEKIIDYVNSEISKIGTHLPKFLIQIKNTWLWFLQIILALILSLVILLDRNKLQKYLLWIKKSNFKFLYKEYRIIFEKVIKSFGLILKAQAMIAIVNAVLTILWLTIIAVIYYFLGDNNPLFFPYILTLWLLVFIFGFIPILWTFLSSIPIIIVGFSTYWGINIVFFIIALMVVIHTIEAYLLNPKIVSKFMNFPVSLTFLILIISEHTFGFAWLLIWVSLFYFLIWLFKDIDEAITRKRKISKIEKNIMKRVREEKMKKYG